MHEKLENEFILMLFLESFIFEIPPNSACDWLFQPSLSSPKKGLLLLNDALGRIQLLRMAEGNSSGKR